MSEALIIAGALVVGLVAGWFLSLKWGRPPAPPTQALIDHEALRQLFSGYVDQVSVVIGGLQEDIDGLRAHLDAVSHWAPGQEPTNPVQLGRFMTESHADRAAIRREIVALRRVVYVASAGVGLILVRIAYVIVGGGA